MQRFILKCVNEQHQQVYTNKLLFWRLIHIHYINNPVPIFTVALKYNCF